MTKEDILNYLKEHKEEFAKKYGVKDIALFGSYARDEATKESDIDIVISMPPKYSNLFNLKEDLEKALKKQVDLIRLRDKMNKYLKNRIDKEAIYV